MHSMRTFLGDYNLGKRQGRYVDAELPSIAFPNKSFDLALCSHFLFLYAERLREPDDASPSSPHTTPEQANHRSV